MKFKFRLGYPNLIAGTFFSLALLGNHAFAQSDSRTPKPGLRYLQEYKDPNVVAKPQSETTEQVVTVPYSTVFKDTDQIDLFREGRTDTYEPRFGAGGGAKVQSGILNGKIGLPFIGTQRFKLDEAELKISNFYIDIRSLSASFLYSDNVNRSEFNREDGTLVGLRLDFAVFAPLTERLSISAAGAFIYLPLDNRAGFAVFDAFKQFEYEPFIRIQLAYDFNVADWEFEVLNDFRIEQVPFDFQLSYSYFNGAFETAEREGRYSYGGGAAGTRVFEDRSPYGQFDAGLVRLRNVTGAKVGRLLPTDTKMEVGAYHSEDRYLNGEENVIGLPHRRDWAYVSLKSEHENIRFKPFAIYRMQHYNTYDHWERELKGGVEGPVTDNIHFYGAVGQRWLQIAGDSETIWELALKHQISPYTFHSVEYHHYPTEPDVDLMDRWIYRITQVIGKGLTADAYVSYADFEDLDGTDTSTKDWRSGVRLIYQPSPKTTFMLAGTYTSIDYTRLNGPDSKVWWGVARAVHKFTPTFEVQMQYQYTDRNSTLTGDSYYESLTTLSLIKYF
jgi:hypothetical protein